MFKQASFEDEIYRSMEKTLVNSQTNSDQNANKLARAADLLSNAAAIFKRAGMLQEAELVLQVLSNLEANQ